MFQPCFLAVVMALRRVAKSWAPFGERNPPEIFWRNFPIRPSRSASLCRQTFYADNAAQLIDSLGRAPEFVGIIMERRCGVALRMERGPRRPARSLIDPF